MMVRGKKFKLVLLAFVGIFMAISFRPIPVNAVGPNLISFQGKVVNANGTNVTNGTYNFDFIMWDDPSAGTNRWQELTKSVSVTNGVFQTNLGSATALPDFNTYPNLHLAIRFNADSNGYMSPRVQMASVPYALNADKVGGVAASSLVQLGATQSGNINISSGTITSGNINGQTISSSANFTGSLAVQGGTATLGASSQAGSLVLFDNGAGSETVTLTTTDITSSYFLNLPAAAGGTSQCLQTDSVTASQLIFASCSASGTAWDSIADPVGNGALAFSNTSQTLNWVTPATATANDGITISITNGSVVDVSTQRALVVTNLNDSASTGTLETIAAIENRDINETVTNGLSVDNTAAGSITNGINITETAGTLTNGIRFGANITSDILFATDSTHVIQVENQDTAATAGSDLQVIGAAGNTTGNGGALILTAGGGGTGASSGGAIQLTTGAGGTTGNSGALSILTGNVTSGTAGNLAVDVGTSTTGAPAINIGQNTNSIDKTITIGSTAGTGTITLGSSSASQTTIIGGGSGVSTVQIAGGSAANIVTIADVQTAGSVSIGNALTSGTVSIAGGSAVMTGNINIGSTGATSSLTVIRGGTGAGAISLIPGVGGNVQIGSATTDTTQALLQVDSFSTFADTTTCNVTTNQGAMYYNTASNVMRGCVNGAWEDMLSTAGLGLQLFGVLPDSGANPGDLAAVTGVQNGPCKVSVGSSTTVVSWTACTAYSGGRKVLVAAGTANAAAGAANDFSHLCLSGTDNQPALSARGTEVANLATISMPSVASPILCLADIKFTGAAATITQIYDTRTYTTTIKETASIGTTNPGIGMLVKYTATKGVVIPATTVNGIAGVVVATTGATSTTTINGIIAVAGPAAVKSITGGNAIGNYIFASATAGYATTTAAKPAEATSTIYNLLGAARTAWSGATACTANADACAGSILTSIDKR